MNGESGGKRATSPWHALAGAIIKHERTHKPACEPLQQRRVPTRQVKQRQITEDLIHSLAVMSVMANWTRVMRMARAIPAFGLRQLTAGAHALHDKEYSCRCTHEKGRQTDRIDFLQDHYVSASL